MSTNPRRTGPNTPSSHRTRECSPPERRRRVRCQPETRKAEEGTTAPRRPPRPQDHAPRDRKHTKHRIPQERRNAPNLTRKGWNPRLTPKAPGMRAQDCRSKCLEMPQKASNPTAPEMHQTAPKDGDISKSGPNAALEAGSRHPHTCRLEAHWPLAPIPHQPVMQPTHSNPAARPKSSTRNQAGTKEDGTSRLETVKQPNRRTQTYSQHSQPHDGTKHPHQAPDPKGHEPRETGRPTTPIPDYHWGCSAGPKTAPTARVQHLHPSGHTITRMGPQPRAHQTRRVKAERAP
jgi:hypothetical protein